MVVEKIDTIANRVFIEGTIEGLPSVLVKAGVGKVNAAVTAEILVAHFQVDAIVFTGVAGGISKKLNVGDIVISQKVLHHDYGLVTPNKFTPFDTVGFAADSFLIQVAMQASHNVKLTPIPKSITKKAEVPLQCVVGRVVTGDQFIASEKKRRWLEKTLRADCVEMEGAAVAQVCALNKIPFVIVRSLSDLANEKAAVDFEAFLPYAAKNSSLLVQELIKLLK